MGVLARRPRAQMSALTEHQRARGDERPPPKMVPADLADGLKKFRIFLIFFAYKILFCKCIFGIFSPTFSSKLEYLRVLLTNFVSISKSIDMFEIPCKFFIRSHALLGFGVTFFVMAFQHIMIDSSLIE